MKIRLPKQISVALETIILFIGILLVVAIISSISFFLGDNHRIGSFLYTQITVASISSLLGIYFMKKALSKIVIFEDRYVLFRESMKDDIKENYEMSVDALGQIAELRKELALIKQKEVIMEHRLTILESKYAKA